MTGPDPVRFADTASAAGNFQPMPDPYGERPMKRPDLPWGPIDHRWFGGGWRERDTWPDLDFTFSLAPWGWRLRPRWWPDDVTWSWEFAWLFVRIRFFTNGERKLPRFDGSGVHDG